jgi:hypothetical protein
MQRFHSVTFNKAFVPTVTQHSNRARFLAALDAIKNRTRHPSGSSGGERRSLSP